MSSAYQSMIDAALRNAQAMASTGVEKTASDPNDFYKEASELANALEYMAISSVNDGSPAGIAQSDMIKDFFKQASKQRMGVPHGSTAATGTQGIAPNQGKLKLNQTRNALQVSSSMDSTGNTMRESYKQASLYDILMGKQAEAGCETPPQYTADTYLDVNNSNENSVRSVLDTNESAAGFQKRHVHGDNIRKRLSEAFAGTNDSLSDATVQQIFPQAYAAGGLKKTASATRSRLNKMANVGQFMNTVGGRALAGGGMGAAVGGLGGYMAGGDAKSALMGAGIGAAAGAGGAALMQRGAKAEQLAAERAMALKGKVNPAGLENSIAQQRKALEGLQGEQLAAAQKQLNISEGALRGAKSMEGMTAEQLAALEKSEQMAGLLGQDASKLQELALARQAASAGGMGGQLGVAAGAGALTGIGAGAMAGKEASALSARSRLRKMQRGL